MSLVFVVLECSIKSFQLNISNLGNQEIENPDVDVVILSNKLLQWAAVW